MWLNFIIYLEDLRRDLYLYITILSKCKFYPEYIPSRYLLNLLIKNNSIRPCKMNEIVVRYAQGTSISQLAKEENLFRERIKNYILAFVRNLKRSMNE